MLHELQRALSGLRQRQRWQAVFGGALVGASGGAMCGAALELLRHAPGSVIPAGTGVWLWLAGILSGWLVGWLRPQSWPSTALFADRHYGLKERMVAALEFAASDVEDPYKQLQIADALERVRNLSPAAVLPWRQVFRGGVPGRIAIPLSLAVLVLAVWPSAKPTGSAETAGMAESGDTVGTAGGVGTGGAAADSSAQAATDDLKETVQEQARELDRVVVSELRAMAQSAGDVRLEQLAGRLEEQLEQLKTQDRDQRSSLRTLSEMQQAMTTTLEAFNMGRTAADLQELAAALGAARAFQAAAEALETGHFKAAAAEIGRLDPADLTHREREAVSANLERLRETTQEPTSNALHAALEQLQAGLQNADPEAWKRGTDKLAEVCQQQDIRQSISQQLGMQMSRLAEAKSQTQAAGARQGSVERSTVASNQVGQMASQRPLGEDSTNLDAQRTLENLTGIQGAGPTERETVRTDGSSQAAQSQADQSRAAQRAYETRYVEFRKRMEAVLETEPLPLGHRQTIRRYFEAIRPAEPMSQRD
jgi:hypothetical protein